VVLGEAALEEGARVRALDEPGGVVLVRAEEERAVEVDDDEEGFGGGEG
jgi:hypothetical protein